MTKGDEELSCAINLLLQEQDLQTKKLTRIESHLEASFTGSHGSRRGSTPLLPLHVSSRTDISAPGQENQTLVTFNRPSVLRVRLYPNACGVNCSCTCHKFTHVKSPSVVQGVLGRLFFGYRGVPALSGKCSGLPCQGNMAQNMNVDYIFPSWMLNKAIRASYLSHVAAGPELCLRMVNVRDHRDDIFKSTGEGDADNVRKLLTEGKASVMDVDSKTGHSPLHVCRTETPCPAYDNG